MYLARSAYKGMQKRSSRAHRRRTNTKAATHEVARRNPRPEITERNQVQAQVLKLPLELRQQIYDHYFRQRTFLMHESYSGGYQIQAVVERHPIPEHNYFYPPAGPYVHGRPNDLLQLPLVCRQIYYESIEYIYKKSTFIFSGYDEALLLPALGVFPQKHLDTLRSLVLRFTIDILVKRLGLRKFSSQRNPSSWGKLIGKSRQRRKWDALWAFLGTLPYLTRLHVTFTRLPGPDGFEDNYVFLPIMEPLQDFYSPERPAVFSVSWQRSTKGWRIPDHWAEDAPYQLAFI